MDEKVLKSEDLRLLRCLSFEKQKRNELVNRSGLPDTQVRYSLQRLIKIGYAKKKSKGYYVKTSQGYEFEKGRETPMELTIDNPELIKIVDLFPTQAHRVIFWFWLASITAKKYLLKTKRFETYNPAFVAIGDTGDVKTLIAETLIKALRLPRTEHLINVINSNRAEILGRRDRSKKTGDWIFKPSPYFDRILICFDEAGQAKDRQTFDAILFYLNGERETEHDKAKWTQYQTALVCMNPKDKWEIPTAYKRRSFILDTRPFDLDPRITADIGEEVSHSTVPKVNLEGLEVDIPYLKPEETKLLKKLLYEGLKGKPEYRLVNPATLEKVVLGWLILTKTHDVIEAIYWGVEGCLCLCSTQGATKEGWRRTLREKWGIYRSGKDPEFKEKWTKEIETLEAEDQAIIDKDKEKERKEDEKIDKAFEFNEKWEETFAYWGKLIMRLDEMFPKFKRANRVAIKNFRDEYSKYTSIPKGKRDIHLLNTIRRLLERRQEAIKQMLTDDVAEGARLRAEKEAKDKANEAERIRKASIIKDRSNEAADLRSKLWNLDTTTGHKESKQLRDALKTIKDHPGSNYARANFPRRKAAALAMIGRFREERERRGAPAGEQISNGVINFLGDLTSGNFFKGKKAKTARPQRGELPPEIVKLRGHPDKGLLEDFGYKEGGRIDRTGRPEGEQRTGRPSKRKVRRGKSIYEKLRDRYRKKKGKGKPEKPTFDGRPFEEKRGKGFGGRDIDEL